ncbi:NUDIX hydrolase [Streptomyces sp. WM6378]|uniref:NUDIX hydrolase n=1 Tax=Streptomyces sp. WM6378 TaxID=1415557 RepID=UPI00131C63C1|nr:hypothetical protein [Streptomyces sp. WM6378]
MRRELYLLCFDRTHRLLLVPVAPHGLALPTGHCRTHETYEQAARRLMASRDLRQGDVVARLEAEPPAGSRGRSEARIFTAHVRRGQAAEAKLGDVWLPWRQALPVLDRLAIPELPEFIEGYVDGWIPDGWITLGH